MKSPQDPSPAEDAAAAPAPSVAAPAGSQTLPHCGVVAVVGRTNSGKSTLVNRIVGEKISIVSPVVQTTRSVVRGVLTDPARGQLVRVDTPGLHKSRSVLCTIMNKHARAAAEGVDAILLVVDGSKDPQLEDDGWMRRLAGSQTPCFILLNKADEGSKLSRYQALWASILEEKRPEAARPAPVWIKASAKTGEGVDALVEGLFACLPPGPTLFDADTLTDYPRKLAVGDIIREKFFLTLRDELPHSIGVKVEDIVAREDGSTPRSSSNVPTTRGSCSDRRAGRCAASCAWRRRTSRRSSRGRRRRNCGSRSSRTGIRTSSCFARSAMRSRYLSQVNQ